MDLRVRVVRLNEARFRLGEAFQLHQRQRVPVFGDSPQLADLLVFADLFEILLQLGQRPLEALQRLVQVTLQLSYVRDLGADVKHFDVVLDEPICEQPLHHVRKQLLGLFKVSHLHCQIGHYVIDVCNAVLALQILGHLQCHVQHLFRLFVLFPLDVQDGHFDRRNQLTLRAVLVAFFGEPRQEGAGREHRNGDPAVAVAFVTALLLFFLGSRRRRRFRLKVGAAQAWVVQRYEASLGEGV